MGTSSTVQKMTRMDIALANMVKPTLPSDQSPKYIGEWLSEHKEIFEKGKFLNNGVEARYVVIFAGVGAGKTDFTTKLLPQYGKVYYNCSRTMIKNQQMKEIQESPYKHNIYIATSWDLINPVTYEIAEEADYIVIDEAHHLIADSFTDAPQYAYELIQHIRENQTVIFMTACYDSFMKALDSSNFFEEYIRLLDYPVCAMDLRECCYNLQPKKIKIISAIKAEKILFEQAENENRTLFYCSSSRKTYRLACKLITKGKRAVAITSSKSQLSSAVNSTIRTAIKREIKRIEKDINSKEPESRKVISLDYNIFSKLLKLEKLEISAEKDLAKEKFPSDVDYVIATSRLREGINIKGSEQVEVFTDIVSLVDLIQIAGRVRKYGVPYNIECLYIVAKTKNSENDFDFRYDQRMNYKNEEEIRDFNNIFGSRIREYMVYEYGSDYDNRLIKPLSKNAFLKHRKRITRLYDDLNKMTPYPGQLYLKPLRSDENSVIISYSVARNDLWFIDNEEKIADNERSGPYDAFEAGPLVSKLKNIFKGSEIEIDNECIQKQKKKALKPNDRVKKIAKGIVLEYVNRYISKDELNALKARLVDVRYINSDSYIGSSIKKIGFIGKWKTTKRQEYFIEEVLTDKGKLT